MFDALFSYVFYPSSSWYLLPSTGMSVYLRLYSSFVINYFKGTACVCAVCCCFCNLLSHRKKLPFIKVLSHQVSEVPLYSWTFIIFFFPQSVEFLVSVYTSNGSLGRNNGKYFTLIVDSLSFYQVFLFEFLRLFNVFGVPMGY